MSRRYPSGSLAGTGRPNPPSIDERDLAALLSESGVIYENITLLVQHDLRRSRFTPERVDGRKSISPERGIWSVMMASLLEGFALYGASVHPAAALLIEDFPVHRQTAAKDSLSKAEWLKSIALASPSVIPALEDELDHHDSIARTEIAATGDGVAVESSRRPGPWNALTWLCNSVADRWTHWRRKRQIEQTVARLKQLDDRTLCDIGVPDRSLIKHAARWDLNLWM